MKKIKIHHLPTICGNENKIEQYTSKRGDLFAPISNIDIGDVTSSFGIALHMHQPTIPASTDDLRSAELISNLQHMMEHQEVHDNHNAPVFLWCYSRMSDFVREFVKEGLNPRVMLDYSGNLLWGLEQMGAKETLDKLKLVTNEKKYHRNVEWLGTMWSHAVISSTPVPDIMLHVKAWQEHFASLFGYDALKRVKGFTAPEMQLPVHPDVCYEYVKVLREYGYEWLMVQEHTIENLDSSGIRDPHFPHRLVVKNSLGETAEIAILIKTQGSDTKLVAQMQPYSEAQTNSKKNYCGKVVPPFVLQISDGENGGVMMNEFPGAYRRVFREMGKGTKGVVSMNGSEYLEFVKKLGLKESDFIPVQPIYQGRIWSCLDNYGPGAADRCIAKAKEKYHINLERASWTNDKNWVKGYDDVLDPMLRLSAEFHNRFDGKEIDESDPIYKEALLYLLLSQTSCFRYWGSGIWTEYAKEIIRRGMEAVKRR